MYRDALHLPDMHSALHYGARTGVHVPMAKARKTARAEVREAQRAWLSGIVAKSGKSLTEIAKVAHVSHTTLTRFNRPDYDGTLNSLTVQQIADAMKVPMPGGSEPEVRSRRQPIQADAERLSFDDRDDLAGAVTRLAGDRDWCISLQMSSRALELRGYLPGDILIVDKAVLPQEGDVVAVSFQEFADSPAQVLVRVYEKLVLTAATLQTDLTKPVIVDSDRVTLLGVVTDLIRTRKV